MEYITILIGIILILSGVFKWNFILFFLTWHIKPDSKFSIMIIRVFSVLFGMQFIWRSITGEL